MAEKEKDIQIKSPFDNVPRRQVKDLDPDFKSTPIKGFAETQSLIRENSLVAYYKRMNNGSPKGSSFREKKRTLERWLDKHKVNFLMWDEENPLDFVAGSPEWDLCLKCEAYRTNNDTTIHYRFNEGSKKELLISYGL